MTERYDLIVIGSGSAGSAPAAKGREKGWRVAVVDELPFGGTCAQRGCDPKKVLVGAAEVVDAARRLDGRGVAGGTRIDWPALMRFKKTFTDPVPESREEGMREAGIEPIRGRARFVAPDRIEVAGRSLAAERFVLALGARPRPLGIPGEERLATSTDFLALERLPGRIAFVGAGYVSMELAHVARRAGAEVSILARGAPLKPFDTDLVAKLVEHTLSLGIDLRRPAEVVALEPGEDGASRVRYGRNGREESLEADLVVHGAGRVPNTMDTGLDAAGVELEHDGGVKVDAHLRSVTNPRVFAGGDCVTRRDGRMPLTPIAGRDGKAIAAALLGEDPEPVSYRAVPSVVFTEPPLAAIGLTEREAREQGLSFTGELVDTSSWYTNRRVGEECAAAKVLVEEGTGRILGAHLLGPSAVELAGVLALAMQHDLPAEAVKRTIFAYPSGASDLAYLL